GAAFQISEYFRPAVTGQLDKALLIFLPAHLIRQAQAIYVFPPVAPQVSSESGIDVIENSGVGRPRRVVFWDDLLGDGLDGARLLGGENLAPRRRHAGSRAARSQETAQHTKEFAPHPLHLRASRLPHRGTRASAQRRDRKGADPSRQLSVFSSQF